MSLEIHPTKFFYWKAWFQDGTILSQFDSEGNEVYVKDFVPKSCWVLQQNGSMKLDINANWFETLERVHGPVTKMAWMPFTKELKEKIISKQNMDIEVVSEYRPIEKRIPDGYFASFDQSTKILHSIRITAEGIESAEDEIPTTAYQGILFIGYLPRDELLSQNCDNRDVPLGKIDQITINPKVKK